MMLSLVLVCFLNKPMGWLSLYPYFLEEVAFLGGSSSIFGETLIIPNIS